jgi:hypothetical protein
VKRQASGANVAPDFAVPGCNDEAWGASALELEHAGAVRHAVKTMEWIKEERREAKVVMWVPLQNEGVPRRAKV